MGTRKATSSRTFSEEAAIRHILEGTSSETGARFFAALVKNLAAALGMAGAWVTEFLPRELRLRAHAFWFEDHFIEGYEYDIVGTPCEPVVSNRRFYHVQDNVTSLFPNDPDLKPLHAVSYMGVPLLGKDDSILGHLAVLDTKPMPRQLRTESLFRIFAARAGAELQRLRAEKDVAEREEKLSRMVNSAMDAIMELGSSLKITRANSSALGLLGTDESTLLGRDFRGLLSESSAAKLEALVADLSSRSDGPRYLWIPGGLEVRDAEGSGIQAEASLSQFEMKGERCSTLILRNVNDRLEAERQIRSLTEEAVYLREEVESVYNFGEIIGKSAPVKRLCRDIRQVAPLDTTVLIVGETGTGKELVARAIHGESSRAGKPLIKVNCAAIPPALIESEFFGHEKGAFTGATQKRQGRFALADKGTIFLDEIGELPLELQGKLLRVLQEGEFEPVGSSQTHKADVRVIAATNRDLQAAVKEGGFREDLFYRLSVFPIEAPPLRDRGEDIPLLAERFAASFGQKIGREVAPLTEDARSCLRRYRWPGNVRELQNVVERAVITSVNGRLNLTGLLPAQHTDHAAPAVLQADESSQTVLTAAQLVDLERKNIECALKQALGKISGTDGAANLLGMPASTLSSRIKSLGIKIARKT